LSASTGGENLDDNGILVTGGILAAATGCAASSAAGDRNLPLPSLENPLVAGRVAYYKRSRQDWFRHVLPAA